MAGVTGMGSPSQVLPPQDELNITPPDGMHFEAPTGQYVDSPRPSLDEIFSQQSAPIASTGVKPSLDEIFGNAPKPEEFSQEPIGMMEELGNFPARAKAAMQVTDKELQTSLEQSFGKDRVRKRNDSIEWKSDQDGKWRVWDAGTEISDFTTDLIRPIIEEVPASAATIAAGIPAVAATLASGGVALPVSATGVALARSGGALVGQGMADFLQSLTGVPRDEDRSALLEYGLSAVLAPAAGALGDYATKKIAQKAAMGSRKLLSPNDLYKEEITGIKESLAKVKELGGMENIPGTDTPLILSQMNPSNPVARELTEKASSLHGFKQAQEQISQGFSDSSLAFTRALGNVNPESMTTGKQFKNYVEETIAKEGALIGEVRKSFKEEAGDVALRIPDMAKRVEDFATSVGFDKVQSKGSADFKKQWVETLVSDGYNKQAASVIAEKTDKVLTAAVNSNGRMKADKLLGMYEELNGVYRNLAKRGMDADPLFKSKIGELRRIVTDQLNESITEVAGGDVGKGYMKSLAKYSELANAGDEFAGLLDKNNLASHSLSKAIFNKGANGLDTLEAAKVLLRDRPDLMSEVKGNFLLNAMSDSLNDVNKVDWVKFNKKVQSIGPEMLESAFGKAGIEGLKAYEVVGKAIQAGEVGASNSPSRALLLKNMALASKSVLTAGNAGLELIKQSDADGAFAEIIAKEGIDNFLKTAPKDSKPILKQILSGFQQAALRTSQVSPIPIRRTGKGMSKESADEKNKRNP